MSEWLLLILYCAILGSGVGFLAGLLGIGGGGFFFSGGSSIFFRFGFFPKKQGGVQVRREAGWGRRENLGGGGSF